MRRWFSFALFAATSCGGSAQAPAPAPTAEAPREVSYDDLVGLSESYLETGKVDRAIEVARDAIEKNADQPAGHLALGRALASGERLEDAIDSYEAARERGAEGHRVTLELATLYDVVRRYEEAIAVYGVHLENHPDDAGAHQQLGLTLLLANQPKAAVASLERSLELAPDEPQTQIDYGMALIRANRPGDAITTLQPVTQNDPERADAWRLLARAEASERDWDDATAHVDRALALQPADREALSLRCRLRVVRGDTKGALEDCEQLQQLDPDDLAVKLRVAGLLAELGRLDDAATLVSDVAKNVPDHPAVQFRRDQIAARRGDGEALTRITLLAEKRQDDPELWREVRALALDTQRRKLARKAKAELEKLDLSVR